ncbi:unnamed protein product [Linum trigynum]
MVRLPPNHITQFLRVPESKIGGAVEGQGLSLSSLLQQSGEAEELRISDDGGVRLLFFNHQSDLAAAEVPSPSSSSAVAVHYYKTITLSTGWKHLRRCLEQDFQR